MVGKMKLLEKETIRRLRCLLKKVHLFFVSIKRKRNVCLHLDCLLENCSPESAVSNTGCFYTQTMALLGISILRNFKSITSKWKLISLLLETKAANLGMSDSYMGKYKPGEDSLCSWEGRFPVPVWPGHGNLLAKHPGCCCECVC